MISILFRLYWGSIPNPTLGKIQTVTVLITFLIAVIKYPRRSNLRDEGLILTDFKQIITMLGQVWQQKERSACPTGENRKWGRLKGLPSMVHFLHRSSTSWGSVTFHRTTPSAWDLVLKDVSLWGHVKNPSIDCPFWNHFTIPRNVRKISSLLLLVKNSGTLCSYCLEVRG